MPRKRIGRLLRKRPYGEPSAGGSAAGVTRPAATVAYRASSDRSAQTPSTPLKRVPVSGEAATAYARAATSRNDPVDAPTAWTNRCAGPFPPVSCRAHSETTASAMPTAKNTQARGSHVFR
ncbi:hypothetical protein GCM10010116_23800 [Microbispora rosea subsp. aerata]|nr:hypothetical protein GCM10010116_23800 [Microbispora rosea subsp. aerata]GIH55691.1 hypothetical protein Mro02_26050 [Microbispora rosea subsp. aerata]GLJ86011.1 hypothetical protein GCM10017588_47440 [Microbispora rosea subsp. aerata]